MASDIVEQAKSQASQVTVNSAAVSDDPIIWVNSRPTYVPMTQGAQTAGVGSLKNMASLSSMQEKVRALGGSRDPQFNTLASKLVKANFISKSYAGSADSVANALEYPVRVYQAYSAYGGTLSFDDWLDWYSSTSTEEGSGGGRYTGPTTTTTYANERDLRSTADAIASEVLGRAVTEDEFQKVLKKVRTAEKTEPTVTTPGIGTSVTQSGITAEGRKSIIQEALMKGPEAREFGQATKMMDLFYSALNARPEGG